MVGCRLKCAVRGHLTEHPVSAVLACQSRESYADVMTPAIVRLDRIMRADLRIPDLAKVHMRSSGNSLSNHLFILAFQLHVVLCSLLICLGKLLVFFARASEIG